MQLQQKLSASLQEGALDSAIRTTYGCDIDEVAAHRARLTHVLHSYAEAFGAEGEVGLFSGPGRTELGGNHTDHQRGRVLAAAVDLDAVACAGPIAEPVIRVRSDGYPDVTVELGAYTPREDEKGTSAALVRGIAARFSELGHPIGGFQAYVESTVLSGSGLSSSAAYEVLIGMIFNHLYCEDAVSLTAIAQIGQYAENVYFGKPCGLMDQLASAVGGVVSIDFADPEEPLVHRIDFDLSLTRHALCIIDSGADHADLTEEYAAIPQEMCAAAAVFGKAVLREVRYPDFWARFAEVREKAGDRAALRAAHFFNDNFFAFKQAQALEKDDFLSFLQLVKQSGLSSATLLQNLSCWSSPQEQAVTIAIALAQHLLEGAGAVRVHGGGFAGTIQAYVPFERLDDFRAGIEAVLGTNSCHVLRVRPVGGAVISQ